MNLDELLRTGGALQGGLLGAAAARLAREDALVGREIDGIRVDAVLGEGGMGRVYRGHDLRLDRPVALKTLRGDGTPERRERLRREARLLSQLDHPGICRIYGLAAADGIDLLVLEFVDGVTLRQRITSGLSRADALGLAIDIAEALAVAHARGIVHRDLKPDNIAVAGGRAKLLDFGIARLEGDGEAPRDGSAGEDASQTRAGTVVGTPRYMSPEQATGASVGASTDVYSLGLVLLEMFGGSEDQPATTEQRLAKLGAITPRAGGLPRDLVDLLRELVAHDAGTRPKATAAATRLRAIAGAPARRRQRLRLAAVVAALVALGGGAFVWSRLDASRIGRIAAQFAGEARDLEWLMQAEQLAPLHDLRPAIAEVRRRMDSLEAQRDQLGAEAVGPAAAALGRAALAIDDLEPARRHLETAVAEGIDDSRVHHDLGRTLAELWFRGTLEVHFQTAPDRKAAAREELERRLVAPARAAFTRSRNLGGEPAAIAAAWLALFEAKPETALAALEGLEDPTSWEVETLRGRIHYTAGNDAERARTEPAFVRHQLDAAEAALDRAVAVGRSASTPLLLRCQSASLGLGWLADAASPGRVAALTRTRSSCHALAVARADLSEVARAKARLAYAESRNATPEQALAHLREAASLLVRAVDGPSPSGHDFDLLAYLEYLIGNELARTGAAGQAEALDRAIAAQRRASELLIGDPAQPARLGQLLVEKAWNSRDRSITLDQEALALAEENLEALERSGGVPAARFNLAANTALLRGMLAFHRGGDCETPIKAALAAAEENANPEYAPSLHAAGAVQIALAQCLALPYDAPLWAATEARIEAALALDPTNRQYLASRAELAIARARAQGRPATDPRPELRRLARRLEAAATSDAHEIEPWLSLTSLFTACAEAALESGADPAADLASARRAQSRLPVDQRPRRAVLAVAVLDRVAALDALRRGVDAAEYLESAARGYQQVSDTDDPSLVRERAEVAQLLVRVSRSG